MTTTTATVESLTAEVRVLQVGNRQITLSVARQLDMALLEDIEPFGRVNLGKGGERYIIGRKIQDGSLVIADGRWEGEPEPAVRRGDLDADKPFPRVCDATLRYQDREGYRPLNFADVPILIHRDAIEPCGIREHSAYNSTDTCGQWWANGQGDAIKRTIDMYKRERAPYRAAAQLPKIILAGLK